MKIYIAIISTTIDIKWSENCERRIHVSKWAFLTESKNRVQRLNILPSSDLTALQISEIFVQVDATSYTPDYRCVACMYVYVHNLSELSHYLYPSYKNELYTLPYACMKFLWDTAREIICSNIMCIIILGKKCAVIFSGQFRFMSLCCIEF